MRYIVVALAIALFALDASATAVTYRYEGQVTGYSGLFSGQGSSQLSGTFSFDSGLEDRFPAFSDADQFFDNMPADNLALTSSFAATLDYGAVHLSGAAAPHEPDAVAWLTFSDNIPCGSSCTSDSIIYVLHPEPFDLNYFFLRFEDQSTGSSPTAIPTGVLDNSTNGARAVLDSLDPSSFSYIHDGAWVRRDASGIIVDQVTFVVTDIAPVPLPAALWLLASGLVGLFGTRARLRRSA